MVQPRIKGQEVLATMSSSADGLQDLTARASLDLSISMEELEEAYLGETTTRKDNIFNGVSGSLEVHHENRRVFDFIERAVERAKRRGNAALDTFTLLVRFSFPNGDTVRLLFEDIYFGEIPINTPGRDEYVTSTIPFTAPDVRFI